ncbi:MAG: hypothetical protein P8104_00970, partial [Gammaproteobacteria bacterium]
SKVVTDSAYESFDNYESIEAIKALYSKSRLLKRLMSLSISTNCFFAKNSMIIWMPIKVRLLDLIGERVCIGTVNLRW